MNKPIYFDLETHSSLNFNEFEPILCIVSIEVEKGTHLFFEVPILKQSPITTPKTIILNEQ